MEYVIPDGAYQILKWFGLIFCPALAALIGAVGPAWGLANVDAIVLTVNAIGVFTGAILGVSQITAKPAE